MSLRGLEVTCRNPTGTELKDKNTLSLPSSDRLLLPQMGQTHQEGHGREGWRRLWERLPSDWHGHLVRDHGPQTLHTSRPTAGARRKCTE